MAGARRVAEVPGSVLAELEAGTRETANLVEGLALDMGRLWRAVFPEWGEVGAELSVGSVTARMALAGRLVLESGGEEGVRRAMAHCSDTVRGWGAYGVGFWPGLSVAERLELVRGLAGDGHFGVREWAWLAVRGSIAGDLTGALRVLSGWAESGSEGCRRFASESTRPRGVWCAHLEELKRDPGRGLVVLEPLRGDGSRYVQDSAGNWLNDAGKSRPEWVREVAGRWLAEVMGGEAGGSRAATERIVRRGLRNLRAD